MQGQGVEMPQRPDGQAGFNMLARMWNLIF